MKKRNRKPSRREKQGPSGTAQKASPSRSRLPQQDGLRPSEFMRARRPYLFSDTQVIEQPQLDRTTFEYHLATLTNRKQEIDFEHFARRLAEKEICPNLIPQTGPTGGGDSKTDTETYPVASEIAQLWYEGHTTSQQASRERWAFAFSAKKDWKAKVRSDIKNIAATGRGHTVAYSITSQYVKDKDRGNLEDELSRAHGLTVRILDRSWIIDRVFKNDHKRLAVETLRLDIPLVSKQTRGPRDTAHQAELEELEAQIKDLNRYAGLGYQFVEDCLETAILARSLELPRTEVDGRFERAIRLAGENGTTQQQVRCAYDKAWTLYWWYEDFAAFSDVYSTVEKLAVGTAQARDLKLLTTLWQLLYTAAARGDIHADAMHLDERTHTLKAELERLKQDKDRPSISARARASLLLVELTEATGNESALRDVLNDFKTLFEDSKRLLNFPLGELIDLFMEIGDSFPINDVFDDLFETMLPIAEERQSRAGKGRMLLRRGEQKLRANKPYEAIRLLGRAQHELALHETKYELIAALAMCSAAYERAGLLWAARASMLLAASQALNQFWSEGRITRQAVACLRRLVWIELQLGRIPLTLAWVECAMTMANAIQFDEGRGKQLEDEWGHLNGALAVLLLRTDFVDRKHLEFLPHVLDQLHLDGAWVALMYALGYEETIREEGIFAGQTSEEVRDDLQRMLNQPIGEDLPDTPEFLNKQRTTLRSSVLGCDVTVHTPNENRALFLAEGILAALEGFLATGLERLMPHASRLSIELKPAHFQEQPVTHTVNEDGPYTVIEVRYAEQDGSGATSPAAEEEFVKLISSAMAYIAMPSDEQFLKQLIGKERAMARGLSLLQASAALINILGEDNPKLRLEDWKPKEQYEQHPVRGKEPWNHGAKSPTSQEREHVPLKPGKGDPPKELFDIEAMKHRDRRVHSLINTAAWDKAGWQGIGYVTAPENKAPPVMSFIFADRAAARRIFAAWRDELGQDERHNRLRISILTGVDKNNPAHYRVVVSTNIDSIAMQRWDQFVILARINHMEPTTSENLDRFRESYNVTKHYWIMPALMEGGIPALDPDFRILKHGIVIRPAWQLEEHDLDVSAIREDDNVLIPDDVQDPPILDTLKRIRERRRRRRER